MGARVSPEWGEDKQSLGWFNAPQGLRGSAQGFNAELYAQSNRRGKRSQARRPVLIVWKASLGANEIQAGRVCYFALQSLERYLKAIPQIHRKPTAATRRRNVA